MFRDSKCKVNPLYNSLRKLILSNILNTGIPDINFFFSDISRGREMNPIQCLNTIDNDLEPKDYVYISKNIVNSDVLRINTKISSVQSCKCKDRCISDDCSCGKISVKCWYDEEGKLRPDFNFASKKFVTEYFRSTFKLLCIYRCSYAFRVQ